MKKGANMANYSGSKLKILYLYKLFLEKTDEEHSISMPEIIRYLGTQGVHAERKSIYDFVYEDFTLTGYDPWPAIKAPVAV